MKRVAIAALVGAIGAVAWLVGLSVEPTRALHGYLFAFTFALTLAIGSLFVVVIGHTAEATWTVAFRRLSESVAATLPALAVLFLPIALGYRHLFPWAGARVPLADGHHLGHNARVYLSPPFFFGRAIVYFAVWIVIAELLRGWSMRQDETPAEIRLARRQRALAAASIPILGVTITWAGFDWLMSLEPSWHSTIYGVYLFAAGFLAALALVAVLARLARPALPVELGPSHYAALGKLSLTFVLFWAYTGFSQFLLIWIADLPHEVTWYTRRTNGSWMEIAGLLVIGHFVLPLAALLSWYWKRSGAFLAGFGAWMILMHAFDVAWLILPVIEPDGAHFSWVDAAALLFVVGACATVGLLRARRHAAYPIHDPCLPLALRYEDS